LQHQLSQQQAGAASKESAHLISDV
jgi:hypothetical protein